MSRVPVVSLGHTYTFSIMFSNSCVFMSGTSYVDLTYSFIVCVGHMLERPEQRHSFRKGIIDFPIWKVHFYTFDIFVVKLYNYH